METQKQIEDFWGKPISTYTSAQGVEDGFLLNVATINPAWARGIVNFVTTNLLGKGYFNEDGSVNVPNLVDLLNQAAQIIKRAGRVDWHFDGRIELPSGGKQLIFVEQNGTGQFTAMLPGDK